MLYYYSCFISQVAVDANDARVDTGFLAMKQLAWDRLGVEFIPSTMMGKTGSVDSQVLKYFSVHGILHCKDIVRMLVHNRPLRGSVSWKQTENDIVRFLEDDPVTFMRQRFKGKYMTRVSCIEQDHLRCTEQDP